MIHAARRRSVFTRLPAPGAGALGDLAEGSLSTWTAPSRGRAKKSEEAIHARGF